MTVGVVYCLLYAFFVYVHVKRTKNDRVVVPWLFKLIFVFNGLLTLLVLLALLLEAVLYSAYAVVVLYAVALGLLPIGIALVSGSIEGLSIMIGALPVWVLAMPTFVAFFSAYNLARLADITWGNRPAASAAQIAQKNAKLGIDSDAPRKLAEWLEVQTRGCQIFNVFFVTLNIILVFMGKPIVQLFAGMLPNSGAILPGDGQTAFTVAEGSFVMCLLWSVPFIVQMVIAFFFHIYLWFTRCFRLCSPMP